MICRDFIAPALDFVRHLLLAIAIEPFHHFLIASAIFDLRFEIGPLHAFEAEERVVERTIEMVFADVAGDEGAAFVERAPKNCVTANADAWTARCFLYQIFPYHLRIHISRSRQRR